ncbi:TerB family tellurite resistance protein [Endozoicomonas sp. SM1973]|uniref:TerB family tellurite resistance protein n=1 Tax=Spartinivicinus marinus TaxID=2994442 RepID=A0A853I9U3_9GAMM|nr:TerB family tellurite resistance protein [Spartinivicinus marinus]MCX4027671.1 TerB family tellurite resistance protein [Spartinivicinus marinus]NYZ66631.1 TerB family tellurite resistance protein [Spartinivicinus marinus]
MHIIIGFLTAVAGLVWALYRLQNSGVDLNSFNPFHWVRRRNWEKKLGTKPLHSISNPMEAAAVLVVAMAELNGTVTQELKQKVILLFASEFNIPEKEAIQLYASSSYLLKDAINISAEVKHILDPTISQYENRHQSSLLSMLNAVGNFEGDFSQPQAALLKSISQLFKLKNNQSNRW